MNVTSRHAMLLGVLLALVTASPVVGAPMSGAPAATLPVTLSFSPNPVSAGAQTQIQVSIAGGSPPYLLWFNSSIPGCNPPSQPFQQNNSAASYPCDPSSSGNFGAHLDVADSAGNHGSASATLNVQSGGSGGNNSGTGGNGTGGIDLSALQDLLPVLMITGIVFLGSVVAIAASFVAMAILVPRRLKQLRNAIQTNPPAPTTAKPPEAAPPKDRAPEEEL